MKMPSFSRILLAIVLFALVIFACFRLYYRLTDDFRLANMTYPLPYHPEWEIPALTSDQKAQLDDILSQPYTYIGKGAQSYAFGSENGKYVLKFFKFKHLKPSVFVDLLPPIYPFKEYKESQTKRKARKLDGVFAGYRLAYETHRAESGLIYIHLNPTHDLHKVIQVKDKLGLSHSIDLDSVVFIVQERVKTTKAVFDELLKAGKIDAVKEKITAIFKLYGQEYSKGIYDKDHGVMHNTGFVDERPVHLDVGKLKRNDEMKNPAVAKKDLIEVSQRMGHWIEVNYPQYYDQLKKAMNDTITEMYPSVAFHLEAGCPQPCQLCLSTPVPAL